MWSAIVFFFSPLILNFLVQKTSRITRATCINALLIGIFATAISHIADYYERGHLDMFFPIAVAMQIPISTIIGLFAAFIKTQFIFDQPESKEPDDEGRGDKTKFGTYSKQLGVGNAIGCIAMLICHCSIYFLGNVPSNGEGLVYVFSVFILVLFSLSVFYIPVGALITVVLLPINLYLFIKNKTDDTIKLTYANIISVTVILVWWGLMEFIDLSHLK